MKRITNPSLVAGKGFILHTKRNNISLEIFFSELVKTAVSDAVEALNVREV